MKHSFKRYFFTGLVVLLPLLITFGIISYLVNLLAAPFANILNQILHLSFHKLDFSFFYLSNETLIFYLSKILAILFLFTIIITLGFLARTYLLNKIVLLFDALFNRIPFLNKIYQAAQQVVKTFLTDKRKVFKDVVMVPYPDPHNSCLGFVVGAAIASCEKAIGKELISVLIPTCPVPLTGFIIMISSKDLIFLDIKMEEAIKYIISCGILANTQPIPILPESAKKKLLSFKRSS